MIRITTLLWVALMAVAGGTVMHVSYQVRRVDRHLAELTVKTRQEQDAIRILSAEWDSLNDPGRIDALSRRYLSLAPTPIQRVVTLEDIPLKPSADQIARLEAQAQTKPGKDRAPARKAAPDAKFAGPALQVAAHAVAPASAPPASAPPLPAPQLPVSARDGVGLILARVERRE
jgi:hypothetical protein